MLVTLKNLVSRPETVRKQEEAERSWTLMTFVCEFRFDMICFDLLKYRHGDDVVKPLTQVLLLTASEDGEPRLKFLRSPQFPPDHQL